MTTPERVEGARRARAAIAYAGLTHKDVALALHQSVSNVRRILDASREQTTWDELWQIADLCSLPRDWFSADLARLPEIVPRGQPVFGLSDEMRDSMEQELEDQVRRVRERAATVGADKRGPRRKVPAR